MKKIVIVGAGSSGLIAAAMMKNYWGDEVDISVYYDKSNKNIAVGESTTPIIRLLLSHLGMSTGDLFKQLKTGATMKLGIHFKEWIPDTEYFHGFGQVPVFDSTNTSAIYSIPEKKFNGGMNYNIPDFNIPDKPFEEYDHAFHIDTQQFSDLILEHLGDTVTFIDTRIKDVLSDGENIISLTTEDDEIVTADLFVDCSGFSNLLFKHLNPKWNDISDALPLDRAIPQQIPHKFMKMPAFTVAEATDNGWIWKIPIGDRYGTGYVYSSRFVSDDEAREKYDAWLFKNFKVHLDTDRIIRYKPGYYEEYFIGNCLAVGLSSGFIEPLEATGLQVIIQQIQEFMTINSTLKNLDYNRRILNKAHRTLYVDIFDFVCLHYNTNRTDSEFWRYMTANKTEWVREFDFKCREEFLDSRTCYREKTFWGLDSFIQVCKGLNMFTDKSIENFLDSKLDKETIILQAKEDHQYIEKQKNRTRKVAHKKVLDIIHK